MLKNISAFFVPVQGDLIMVIFKITMIWFVFLGKIRRYLQLLRPSFMDIKPLT